MEEEAELGRGCVERGDEVKASAVGIKGMRKGKKKKHDV